MKKLTKYDDRQFQCFRKRIALVCNASSSNVQAKSKEKKKLFISDSLLKCDFRFPYSERQSVGVENFINDG